MSEHNQNSKDIASNKEKEESKQEEVSDKDQNKFISEENSPIKNPESQKEKRHSLIPEVQSKPKHINYQISLIDENLLKVTVSTKNGVKINSSIREKKTTTETQSNEIYLYPKPGAGSQEVDVMIALDYSADEKNIEAIVSEAPISEFPEIQDLQNEQGSAQKGNYQINLINENLLRVKVITEKGVKIETAVRDKKSLAESQSNKIHLQPKLAGEVQEIEITIEIETENKGDVINATKEGQIKLIPNPEVVDLIEAPDYSDIAPTIDESNEIFIGSKNPFQVFKKLIRRNLTVGLIIAIAIHVAAATIVYFNLGKGSSEAGIEDTSRLIIIQDLPDPKIKLTDVEDPNKPKIEEVPAEVELKEEPKRDITPRKTVKPPRVIRPETEEEKIDTSLGSDLSRELDSLRRLTENTGIDTTLSDTTTKSSFEIPDSLRNNFNENDIGLAMYFPKNWKIIDQRDINKQEKSFKGVVLTDTTAEQSGTMNMFIHLDPENKEYNAEDFKTEFEMNDSNLNAFSKEPKTLAGFTEYRFYIFNKFGTEKLSLRASVRKQFFDQYKNEIEAVVRSISIKKKEDL